MNGLSPWAVAAANTFSDTGISSIFTHTCGVYTFNVYCIDDSFWILAEWPNGGRIAFRAAYAPNGKLELTSKIQNGNEVKYQLRSVIGTITVTIQFGTGGQSTLRYISTLKPDADLFLPFWPRDIVIPGKNGKPENTAGQIHVSQEGTRSGVLYFSMTRPKAGSVLYMQNLTALADYNQQTETSAGGTVGGQWPEMGFVLPPAINKPLKAGKDLIISDAIIIFNEVVPADEAATTEQYLNMLAEAYMLLPKPDTNYRHWPDILDKGLQDLINNHGCWSQVKGRPYVNAYVSDYATPPEVMVQLAVLLPLVDYAEWSGRNLDIMQNIKDALPTFYDEKLGTIMRWLPAVADTLEGEEEQKKPMVMDSWYLHHPLLNLSRLALKGDATAKRLFLDSIGFAIKVAHHFDYEWPVFYNMETLEVLKAETNPGNGGEKDVPGLYAHVMLQAYELTGEKRYLNEAEKSAQKLQGLGFDVFYQANNTTFSAGALLRLYKITNKKLYLELSYMCLASVFKNVALWDCNYGYGKNFPSFFCLFPLNDAPYTAVYEEQEVFCAIHDYLKHAQGVDILPSVSLLLAEYVKYLIDRAVYYYPTMLPKEMLSENVKIGELDPNLWIALEDMHDGWEQCGQVGQEVYGAGNAFGILPRHYLRVPDEHFMVYVDYPTDSFTYRKGAPITFSTLGDSRLKARLMIVKMDEHKLPDFTVTVDKDKQALKGELTADGHMEYIVRGNQKIHISWK